MAGSSSTPRAAIHAFIEPLQQSLSCITPTVLEYRTYGNKVYPNQEPHEVTVNRGDPIRLTGRSELFFTLGLHYRVVQDSRSQPSWRVQIVGYIYALDDPSGKEILAYHWHPETPHSVVFPHMHLGAGTGMTRQELFRAHLPTGYTALEDMIQLVITAFGIRPLRSDWNSVLERH